MKTYKLVPVLLYGLSVSVLAADLSTTRTHPLDNNPACLDRQSVDCVIPDNSPRVQSVIVPNVPATPQPQNPPTTAPATESGVQNKPPANTANRQDSGVVVIPETPQTSGITGSSNVPSLPPADQTGDFSAGRTRSGSARGSTIVPNSPPADQTGDFSAGLTRNSTGTATSTGTAAPATGNSTGAPAAPSANSTSRDAVRTR